MKIDFSRKSAPSFSIEHPLRDFQLKLLSLPLLLGVKPANLIQALYEPLQRLQNEPLPHLRYSEYYLHQTLLPLKHKHPIGYVLDPHHNHIK